MATPTKEDMKKIIGYDINNIDHYINAFNYIDTKPYSYSNTPQIMLGEACLGYRITEFLFYQGVKNDTHFIIGKQRIMRRLERNYDFKRWVRLPQNCSERLKKSIMEDVLYSFVGAINLDYGPERCLFALHKFLGNTLDKIWKDLLEKAGPDPDAKFLAEEREKADARKNGSNEDETKRFVSTDDSKRRKIN